MKKISETFLAKLIAVTIAAFIVFNFTMFGPWLSKILSVLQPIFIGTVFALILHVPMQFLEKIVFKKLKKDKLKKALSLFLSILFLLGIIALIFGLALPSGAKSIQTLISQVSDNSIWTNLRGHGGICVTIANIGEKLYGLIVKNVNNFIPQALSLAQNAIKVIFNLILGIALAIMILANKENLMTQVRKVLAKFVKSEKIKKTFVIANLAVKKFSRYLGGSVIEAFILGTVCYIFMLILRLPYPALVAVIIGFVNLIPYIGPYIGGAICTIMIFAVSPVKAIIFIVFVLILQQVEGMTTYPIIVGRYVGLNGFWIMVSVLIWGGFLGFWGIFLGVPFTAFLHDFIKMLPDKAQRLKTQPLLTGKVEEFKE